MLFKLPSVLFQRVKENFISKRNNFKNIIKLLKLSVKTKTLRSLAIYKGVGIVVKYIISK